MTNFQIKGGPQVIQMTPTFHFLKIKLYPFTYFKKIHTRLALKNALIVISLNVQCNLKNPKLYCFSRLQWRIQ